MSNTNIATKAVTVAGSIGGVASMVGRLAGALSGQSGTWIGSLKQASFGGVPFGIEMVRTTAGRKTAVHNYPFRDDVWVEDLGKKGRQFEVLGFLVEDDIITKAGPVIAQREALLTVCETPGPQTLVHPTLGTVKNVACLSVETIERVDLGRVFEIRLTLVVDGGRKYPGVEVSTAAASSANAAKSRAAALLDFIQKTASAVRAGAAIVQQAVSTVVGWYQVAVGLVNDVKMVINAVSTLFGNFGRLFGGGNSGFSASNPTAPRSATASTMLAGLAASRANVVSAGSALQAAAANPADAATLGSAAQGLALAVAKTATDPADALRMVGSLAQYDPAQPVPPGQIGAAMGVMQSALGALLRRYALAQLAECLTTYQPASREDADAVMNAAIPLFDAEILVAADGGDDNSYLALRALRQSVLADMNARGADAAVVSTFEFPLPMPSLALATRIYRDAGREGDLVRQIDPIHPAFCPKTFQALSN